MKKDYTIAVAGTGYVGLSIATLLSQHHKVMAVDIVKEKVDLINNRKSPIQDNYIEKYLAEKELNLTATLDISRHELNNNKDVIRKWNKQVGYEIQRKVAENCINVLKKNNIDFEIHDLLSEREESFLKEKNFFAEKSFLTMRNVLNELLR